MNSTAPYRPPPLASVTIFTSQDIPRGTTYPPIVIDAQGRPTIKGGGNTLWMNPADVLLLQVENPE